VLRGAALWHFAGGCGKCPDAQAWHKCGGYRSLVPGSVGRLSIMNLGRSCRPRLGSLKPRISSSDARSILCDPSSNAVHISYKDGVPALALFCPFSGSFERAGLLALGGALGATPGALAVEDLVESVAHLLVVRQICGGAPSLLSDLMCRPRSPVFTQTVAVSRTMGKTGSGALLGLCSSHLPALP
jgi:hypothetical protein